MRSLSLALSLAAAATSASATQSERLEALAREIAPKVAQIRGLSFEREVAVRVVDDATARAHFEQRLLKSYPRERIAHDQAAMIQLGLLPPGTEILSTLLDLLEEQAGGFYDPESDTFFILDDTPPDLAPMLMAHELTHALDDQHYDIDGLLAAAELDDDRTTALSALVEGSGQAVMSAFTLGEMKAGRMSRDVLEQIQKSEAGKAARLRASPPWIQRSLVAPYILGLNFVLRGDPGRLNGGSFSADLDTAFASPPSSSEQILHPFKYWDEPRDAPLALRAPDLSAQLGPGWSLASSGRLGELGLAVLTGATAPDPNSPDALQPRLWTNPAATGLAGDVYQHYAAGSRRVTLLYAIWDDSREADEFVSGLLEVAGRRAFQVEERVLLVAGDAEGRESRLAAAAFSGLRSGH